MEAETSEPLTKTDTQPGDALSDLRRLMPVIVPTTYFSQEGVPAVHIPLPCEEFSLAAVFLDSYPALDYLTAAQAQQWEAEGILWRERALKNLYRETGSDLLTNTLFSEDGRLLCAYTIQEDGLGSSRILCTDTLRTIFPDGYWVAIPERSMGIIISKRVTREEYHDIAVNIVMECYRMGSVPHSPRIFEPEELGA